MTTSGPVLNPPRLGDPIDRESAYRTRRSAANQAAAWNEVLADDPVCGPSSGLVVGVAPRAIGGRFQLVWTRPVVVASSGEAGE